MTQQNQVKKNLIQVQILKLQQLLETQEMILLEEMVEKVEQETVEMKLLLQIHVQLSLLSCTMLQR